MKHPICFALALTFFAGLAVAQLPSSLEEFKARAAVEAKDPEKAVKLWFDAVFVYMTKDKELGASLITEMMKDKNWRTAMRYKYFVERLNGAQHIFRSYAVGATPENDYAMDPENYQLDVTVVSRKPFADKAEGEFVKLRLVSGGAVSPRPATVEQNSKGEYKLYEIGGLYTEVRLPKGQDKRKDF
jgi:hypothetical protein